MSNKALGWKRAAVFLMLLVWCCSAVVSAEGLSGDNSLSTLGITTEGATVSPEFLYSTIEYNVTVPAGTSELSLSPETSNSAATITDISGTVLDENGEGTVVITVTAENGNTVAYYLYVTSEQSLTEAQTETEPVTERQTETETETETEDPRYIRVDRNSLEEAENTIETLKTETASYRDRVTLLTRILYGMIAFCVVLLFAVINLILKKKDLKAELETYRDYAPAAGTQNAAARGVRGGRGTPDAGYTEESQYGSREYGAEPQWESPAEGQASFRQEAPQAEPVMTDDPATVPKPSKARKKPKKMPEYRQQEPAPEYQPHSGKENKDVEVTMIDL